MEMIILAIEQIQVENYTEAEIKWGTEDKKIFSTLLTGSWKHLLEEHTGERLTCIAAPDEDKNFLRWLCHPSQASLLALKLGVKFIPKAIVDIPIEELKQQEQRAWDKEIAHRLEKGEIKQVQEGQWELTEYKKEYTHNAENQECQEEICWVVKSEVNEWVKTLIEEV
jgi:hypothetical protein